MFLGCSAPSPSHSPHRPHAPVDISTPISCCASGFAHCAAATERISLSDLWPPRRWIGHPITPCSSTAITGSRHWTLTLPSGPSGRRSHQETSHNCQSLSRRGLPISFCPFNLQASDLVPRRQRSGSLCCKRSMDFEPQKSAASSDN